MDKNSFYIPRFSTIDTIDIKRVNNIYWEYNNHLNEYLLIFNENAIGFLCYNTEDECYMFKLIYCGIEWHWDLETTDLEEAKEIAENCILECCESIMDGYGLLLEEMERRNNE